MPFAAPTPPVVGDGFSVAFGNTVGEDPSLDDPNGYSWNTFELGADMNVAGGTEMVLHDGTVNSGITISAVSIQRQGGNSNYISTGTYGDIPKSAYKGFFGNTNSPNEFILYGFKPKQRIRIQMYGARDPSDNSVTRIYSGLERGLSGGYHGAFDNENVTYNNGDLATPTIDPLLYYDQEGTVDEAGNFNVVVSPNSVQAEVSWMRVTWDPDTAPAPNYAGPEILGSELNLDSLQSVWDITETGSFVFDFNMRYSGQINFNTSTFGSGTVLVNDWRNGNNETLYEARIVKVDNMGSPASTVDLSNVPYDLATTNWTQFGFGINCVIDESTVAPELNASRRYMFSLEVRRVGETTVIARRNFDVNVRRTG